MVTKKKKSVKKIHPVFKFFLIIKFFLTIPFWIINFFYKIFKNVDKQLNKELVKKKRETIKSNYEKFKVIEILSGEFNDFENKIQKSDSTIGIILGARGSGKSAVAIKMFENLHEKSKAKLYAIGFEKSTLPVWIESVGSIEKIKNNAHILIDEGGILFNSRDSMSSANKLLSELMLIARHKNLSILFISQNSSNLEINILRQADYLILKPSSLLQKNFERKIIMNLYTKTEKNFNKYKKDKGICYIHSDDFQGFVSNKLPSFWSEKVSKGWKGK